MNSAGVKGAKLGQEQHFNVANHAQDAAISGAGVVLVRTVLSQGDLESGHLVAPFDLKHQLKDLVHVLR